MVDKILDFKTDGVSLGAKAFIRLMELKEKHPELKDIHSRFHYLYLRPDLFRRAKRLKNKCYIQLFDDEIKLVRVGDILVFRNHKTKETFHVIVHNYKHLTFMEFFDENKVKNTIVHNFEPDPNNPEEHFEENGLLPRRATAFYYYVI